MPNNPLGRIRASPQPPKETRKTQTCFHSHLSDSNVIGPLRFGAQGFGPLDLFLVPPQGQLDTPARLEEHQGPVTRVMRKSNQLFGQSSLISMGHRSRVLKLPVSCGIKHGVHHGNCFLRLYSMALHLVFRGRKRFANGYGGRLDFQKEAPDPPLFARL